MAITRIWQSGAEAGSIDEVPSVYNNLTVQTTDPKTGSYCFRDQQTGYGIIATPATRQIRAAGDVKGVTLANGRRWFIRSGGTFLVELLWLNSTYLDLKVGGTTQDSLLGGNEPNWRHFGIDVKINSSTGWVKVYRDGLEVLSYSGNTGDADISDFCFGNYSEPNYQMYYDNMYVDDTTGESAPAPLPIKRFYYLKPNAVGNYSQWNKSSGSDGYDLVDEVPPSDTDYIESDAVGEKESYNMTTYTIDTGEAIEAVIPTVRAAKSGANEQIKLGTRLSSTDLQGSALDLGSSPDYVWERQTTKPGGGSWAQADLDAFEVLAESAGSF